ncbi:membrane-spanning 4-domains subfamily A member 4D-like [Engystomops pustulosus]|uniref:membrane-spanning 4-domains subfamily A member 4D-like n=1 Tax=Engystomops pustulosus TaxID=76066 RepID=UPI003AFB1577
MSSPLNDVISVTYPEQNPPPYSEIGASPIWTTSLPQSDDIRWKDQSPPAYHTLSNVPPMNVLLPSSQLGSSPTVTPWIVETPRPYQMDPLPSRATSTYSHQSPTVTAELTSNNVTPPRRVNAPNPRTTSSVIEQRFKKGRPNVCGGVIIAAAFVQIGVSMSLPMDNRLTLMSYGIPYWTSAFYLTTGSLLLAAAQKPSLCFVKSSVCVTIVACILCAVGMTFSIFGLQELEFFDHFNDPYRGASSLYYTIIAMNALVLLLSFPATCYGVYALSWKSKHFQLFPIPNAGVSSASPPPTEYVTQRS